MASCEQRISVSVIGAGFAGAQTALDLSEIEGLDITVIDPKEYFENPLSTVRSQLAPPFFEGCSRPHSEWVRGKFVQGTAVDIRDRSVLVRKADGSTEEVKFDYAGHAMGTRSDGFKPEFLTLEARRAELRERADLIKRAESVLIVGGGPVGVELMGEILAHYPEKRVTLLHSRAQVCHLVPGGHELFLRLLARFPNARFIGNDRIKLEQASKALEVQPRTYETQSGQKIEADLVIHAFGGAPNTEGLRPHLSDALTPSGFIKTLPTLQVVGHPSLFVVGDLAETGRRKAAVNTKDHPPTVAANIASLIANRPATAVYSAQERAPWPHMIPFGPDASITVQPSSEPEGAGLDLVRSVDKRFSEHMTMVMARRPPSLAEPRLNHTHTGLHHIAKHALMLARH